jgi:glycosyltransferase involved in cell wall biosynthesis
MNKVMEYMALSKPVVAFDLVETRFSAQDAAVYAPANDVLAFARCVVWLLDHPEECERLGRQGRHRVDTCLAWEFSVDHLLSAYRDGLGMMSGEPLPGVLSLEHERTPSDCR